MPALSAAGNVENTALVLLERKGYQYWYRQEADLCFAEKDGWDFCANGWIELLGIVAIFETLKPEEYREYWWRIREPWLKNDLPVEPRSYVPVWRKSRG